jgi:CHAT domain-containing protein/tetratricopeptide (TPR) repeat protein
LALIAVANIGCRTGASAEAAFQQIREETRKGQLDAALGDVDAALSKFQTKDPQWAARLRVQKAHIFMMRGAYSDSLRLLSQPLPAALAHTETEVQQDFVQALDYDGLQQPDAADRVLSEAETLSTAIHSTQGASLAQVRGILEVNRKNYDQAAAAFRKAAATAREQKLATAELNALGNLGNVAMWQEHYDEAIDHFRAALDRSRPIGAIGPESKSLGNLGWAYLTIGDFDNAERSFRDAQAKAEQAGLVEDQTYWLIALADVEALQHRFAEADSTGRRALALAENHDDKNTLVFCLDVLARVALLTGRLDDATKFNRRAADIEKTGEDQSQIIYSQLISGRIAVEKHDYPVALAALRRVLTDPKSETRLKWEAHVRVAEVYAAQGLAAKAESEFAAAVRIFQNARDSIQDNELRVSFLSNAIEFYQAYVAFLIGQHRPFDALKIADLSRSQSLEQSLSSGKPSAPNAPRPFNPQDTARRLNATLLFYWLGWDRSWLWVVTPAKTSLLSLPASPELDAAVKSYLESFTDPRDPLESGNADARRLYAKLVQPAERLMARNSRVVILPDGSLNSLNFETLIVDAPKPHYWIEDATVATASSLSALARSSASVAPQQPRLLLVGDALPASPDFPPLPQAGKEISLLENYFPREQRVELTARNATARNFLSSQPQEFAYLHFTAHGTASRLRPLESAIILSPEGDSYKLYARDIVHHPLNAYLVIISACNGAGIKTYAGEGLVGLSWAFLRAGAHNVIAGLWEVSNASTPQLMDQLYNGLHAGQDPATALRNAKLSLLHSSGNYRRPFYWGPFLLYSGS